MAAVTHTEVQELLESRGFRSSDEEIAPSVFAIVLERFMQDREIETFDELHFALTEAAYELDFETFLDACSGDTDAMTIEFVRGVVDVLDIVDNEELAAFAWAYLWGSE
jgi:hypothetical protein